MSQQRLSHYCRPNRAQSEAFTCFHLSPVTQEVDANVKYPHPIDGLGVGAAPIHVAAQYGATGAVTTLLDAGADKEQVGMVEYVFASLGSFLASL